MIAVQPLSASTFVERTFQNLKLDPKEGAKLFDQKIFLMTGFHIDELSRHTVNCRELLDRRGHAQPRFRRHIPSQRFRNGAHRSGLSRLSMRTAAHGESNAHQSKQRISTCHDEFLTKSTKWARWEATPVRRLFRVRTVFRRAPTADSRFCPTPRLTSRKTSKRFEPIPFAHNAHKLEPRLKQTHTRAAAMDASADEPHRCISSHRFFYSRLP